jgi:arylsulfatase
MGVSLFGQEHVDRYRAPDGEEGHEGAVGATAAMMFSADDTCDVGKEGGALVAEDYPVPNDFTGEVNWVDVLDPDELLRVAMARQ